MALFGGLEAALKINAGDFARGLRSAQGTVTSFGRSVGSTFDSVGDEASEMGRSVVGASGGFGILEDSLSDVLVPSTLLSSQLDEVGDEAGEAGRKAGMASIGFTTLTASSTGLSFALGLVSTSATTTAIALGSLLTVLSLLAIALAPLVIGAAAIAAAFGLIVGTGIIAGFKELKTAFAQAKKQIMPMVKAFGKRFVPFLKETIKMLPGLVKAIFKAIGPLDKFFSALRTLRNLAFKFLPKFIGWFFDLGRWALPILTKLGAFVLNKVVPALRKLVDWGKQIWKTVGKWVDSFKNATKKGSKLRTKFNQLKTAGMKFWKKALKPTLKKLKPFIKQLVKLAPLIAKVALDIAKLALNLGTKLLPYLIPIIDAATKLVKWFNSLSYGVKRLIIVAGGLFLALGPILSILGTLWTAFSTIVGIVGSVIAIFNPLTLAVLAIGAIIAGLAYIVYENWDKIKSWTKDLVSSVVGWLKGLIDTAEEFGAAIANGLVDMFNAALPDRLGIPEITIPRVEFSIPGLTIAGHTIYDGQSIGIGPFGPFGGQSVAIPQLASGGYIRSAGLAMLHAGERVITAAQVDNRENGGGAQNITVTIQTDDAALSEWIKKKASVVVEDDVSTALAKAQRRGVF